jgi:hypothetical protein
LRWRNGVIGPEPVEAAGDTPFGKLGADVVFLDLVREFEQQGRVISASPQALNFAPRVFEKLPAGQSYGYRKDDFRRAMERLFKTGKIENIPYGRKGDERRKITAGPGETSTFENTQCPDF